MESLRIKSSIYDYDVLFIESFEKVLYGFEGSCTYVIDRNVYRLYAEEFKGLDKRKIFLIDAIEERKNIDVVLELINFWRQEGIKKDWKVICFGGGITQDITTFASNIYLRNLEWFFFPTTLLAMADSCIGGKCGINLGDYKNQLGVFYPPKKVFICGSFLNTLSKVDWYNGWGELLKFSLTEDDSFYKELSSESKFIPCETIDKYIYRGLKVKKSIIEIDEFEGDLRRILNYGHTFGHALEAYTHHEVSHGIAVIWGIDVVNYISWQEGMLSEEAYYSIKTLIKKAFLEKEIRIEEPEKLFAIIGTDKKVRGNNIYLAILERISHLVVYPMKLDEHLKSLFIAYLEETHGYYCY